MSDRSRTRGRQALLAVALLAGAAGIAAPSAQSQAAPATVTVTGTDSTSSTATDCRGETRTTVGDDLTFTVTRTGDTTAALAVDVSYAGDLADGLPDPVTIPAGSASTTLTMPAQAAGTATLDLGVPDPAYVVGTPSSATVAVRPLIADLACNLGQTAAVEQTVDLANAPTAVDLDELLSTDVSDAVLELEGDVPPGLTFAADGTWTGTATELGDFAFTAYFCDDDGFCFDQLDVTIHVVDIDVSVPINPPRPGQPAPARPLPGQPTFTG